MEIFLLAVISRAQLNTLYRLQREVNLQPGSIRQALRNLEDAGLITRPEAAARGPHRRAISVTPAGENFLDEHWRDSLESKQEMESVIRGVTVALLLDDTKAAIEFLQGAAVARAQMNGIARIERAPPLISAIDFHRAMRALHGSRRRAMETSVLEEFAETLRSSAERKS